MVGIETQRGWGTPVSSFFNVQKGPLRTVSVLLLAIACLLALNLASSDPYSSVSASATFSPKDCSGRDESAVTNYEAKVDQLKADQEVQRAKSMIAIEWRSLSYTHEYWVELALGIRPNRFAPAATQLGIWNGPELPPPSSAITFASGETHPLMWRVPASSLISSSELNATRVAQDPSHPIMLAADVFFVDSCVRVISTPECDWMLDWRNMAIAIHGGWAKLDCAAAGDTLSCSGEPKIKTQGMVPMSRVRVRTDNEWSVIAEFCSQHLTAVDVLDFELHGWGLSKRHVLHRVDNAQRPTEEVAMVVLFNSGARLLPLWLQYWRVLGVGRFYIYVNGPTTSLSDEEPAVAAQLAADPGVTLIDWEMPFSQKNGIYIISPTVCSGHYSQIMAFNHAFERVRRRHLYIGFFDPDEYGVYDAALLQTSLSRGANPTLQVLGRYGFPPALALSNQFGALVDPLYEGVLTPSVGLARRWYVRDELEPLRSKSFVRTVLQWEDVNVGNHNLWPMINHVEMPKTGTVYVAGSGYETRNQALATRAVAVDATFLHVLNFKDHSSKMQFDLDEEIAKLVEGKRTKPAVDAVIREAEARCLACSAGEPGCGYDC